MWNAIHKEVQGRGHIVSGTPCQDKTFSMVANGVHAIALADGAGSAKLSHFGAQETVKCICEEMSSHFHDYFNSEDAAAIKVKLIALIRSRLQALQESLDCELKDLASTLLFAVVKDDSYILGHLGDGVIGFLKNGEVKVASAPENGEFVNTTIFTTSKGAERALKLIKGKLNGIRGFILMSDGPEACLYNKRETSLSKAVVRMMEDCILLESEAVGDGLSEGLGTQIRTKTIDDCSIAFLFDDRDEFAGYSSLQKKERVRLLNLKPETANRVLSHYDVLLRMAEFHADLKTASKEIHLKPKYARKYVSRLCRLGFMYQKDGRFKKALKF